MKKLALFACSLCTFATFTQAKEAVKPVEVIIEPIIIEEVATIPVVTPLESNPWGYVNLRAGWDFWSEYGSFNRNENNISSLSKKTKNFGGEISAEAYKNLNHFDIGVGVAYQNHSNRKNNDNVSGTEFYSVPFYATARYDINYWDWCVTPYIKTNLGYSFNFNSKDYNQSTNSYGTKVEDGMYWAAGAGVQYDDFNVDVLYGVNRAKTTISGRDDINKKFSNDYQSVTVSIGYRFDI